MSKYRKNPTLEDFKEWCETNKELAQEFYDYYILPRILDLEQDDYFGTEGFDKRFG